MIGRIHVWYYRVFMETKMSVAITLVCKQKSSYVLSEDSNKSSLFCMKCDCSLCLWHAWTEFVTLHISNKSVQTNKKPLMTDFPVYGNSTVHRLRDGEAGSLICQQLLHMPEQMWVSIGIVSVLYNSSERWCYTEMVLENSRPSVLPPQRPCKLPICGQ